MREQNQLESTAKVPPSTTPAFPGRSPRLSRLPREVSPSPRRILLAESIPPQMWPGTKCRSFCPDEAKKLRTLIYGKGIRTFSNSLKTKEKIFSDLRYAGVLQFQLQTRRTLPALRLCFANLQKINRQLHRPPAISKKTISNREPELIESPLSHSKSTSIHVLIANFEPFAHLLLSRTPISRRAHTIEVDRLSRPLLYQEVCVVPAICRVAGTEGAGTPNPSKTIQQHTPPTPGGDCRQAFTSFIFLHLQAFRLLLRPVLEPSLVTPKPPESPSLEPPGAPHRAISLLGTSGANPCFPGRRRGYNAAFWRARGTQGARVAWIALAAGGKGEAHGPANFIAQIRQRHRSRSARPHHDRREQRRAGNRTPQVGRNGALRYSCQSRGRHANGQLWHQHAGALLRHTRAPWRRTQTSQSGGTRPRSPRAHASDQFYSHLYGRRKSCRRLPRRRRPRVAASNFKATHTFALWVHSMKILNSLVRSLDCCLRASQSVAMLVFLSASAWTRFVASYFSAGWCDGPGGMRKVFCDRLFHSLVFLPRIPVEGYGVHQPLAS